MAGLNSVHSNYKEVILNGRPIEIDKKAPVDQNQAGSQLPGMRCKPIVTSFLSKLYKPESSDRQVQSQNQIKERNDQVNSFGYVTMYH
jgi:hypothetical protein